MQNSSGNAMIEALKLYESLLLCCGGINVINSLFKFVNVIYKKLLLLLNQIRLLRNEQRQPVKKKSKQKKSKNQKIKIPYYNFYRDELMNYCRQLYRIVWHNFKPSRRIC